MLQFRLFHNRFPMVEVAKENVAILDDVAFESDSTENESAKEARGSVKVFRRE
jgi:hypothetical protein